VSAGLSLIFGVTRIVNFAHGSLYMLGLYGAYSLIQLFGRTPLGFWGAVALSALLVGLAGILIEVLVLRRIYKAPELFQLLATFAVVLVIKDIALFAWGPEDLVGPRAPGLSMAVEIMGRRIPACRSISPSSVRPSWSWWWAAWAACPVPISPRC